MCMNKMILKAAALQKGNSEVIYLSIKSIWEVMVYLFKKWCKKEDGVY